MFRYKNDNFMTDVIRFNIMKGIIMHSLKIHERGVKNEENIFNYYFDC